MTHVKLITNIEVFWSKYLTVLPYDTLSQVTLPNETIIFLTKVGIPFQTHEYNDKFPMAFFESINSIEIFSFEGISYLSIAEDTNELGVKIGIRELSGEVFNIASFLEQPVAFINSNVIIFLEFLRIYWQILSKSVTEKDVIRAIKLIKTEFKKLDPNALKEDAYWTEVLGSILFLPREDYD